jgi:hypothetical protein
MRNILIFSYKKSDVQLTIHMKVIEVDSSTLDFAYLIIRYNYLNLNNNFYLFGNKL